MSGRSLRQLEELFGQALAYPPEDRDSFLDDVCRDDPELRREVEELLSLHDGAECYFDELAGDIAAAAPLELESAAQPRIRIGSYRTLAAIGHGGMGAVYRAARVDGAFDQQVALKLLHRDMETPQLKARFLAERQLLARLSHPHIAHLADGGVTEEGRPYFVMEYVEGLPITRHCEKKKLSTEKVLRLFLDVIDAVSYLHRNLVVHRDLKPGNIFVDQDGQVKLLDFGIAKLLDEAGAEGQTRTGELLMTPEYAAPEQLLGAPVTTATDVYALGVVLYELLAGQRPHHRAALDSPVSRGLPPTPSSLLSSQRRRPPGGEASEGAVAPRRIDADLDNICLMALRPEPEARYQSAEQLGRDIERYLRGLPVRARKSTFSYRLGKFARRHRRGLLLMVAVLALITVGYVRERGLRGEAEQARSEAQLQAARAMAVSGFLGELLSSVDPRKAQGEEVTVAEVLEEAATRLGEGSELSEQPAVEAAVRQTIGNTYVSLGRYEAAREHLERAVELYGGIESRSSEALTAAAELGLLYLRLDLRDRAEALLRRVLEARVETLGEDHPSSLTAMNYLADLLWAQGRYEEVERIDRRTLAIRRRILGEHHPDTLRSVNGLAATLFTRGRYAEAAQLFEEVLAVKRQRLGDSHPDTLMVANNLAAAYLELGRYRQAEPLLREIISVQSRVLGPEHGNTVMSVHNLGVTLLQQARYQEAEEQLRRAVATRQRMPGAEKGLLFSRYHLAEVFSAQGRHGEAEKLFLSTLEQQRQSLGPEHQETLKTVGGLAVLRVRQGDLTAAEALIDEIIDAQSQVCGEGHPDTMLSLTTLARIRNEQGRYAEALAVSERAIAAGSRALGPDHLVVLAAVFEQARALAGQQQPRAARELAARIHEVRSSMLGEEHPDTIAARRLLDRLGGDQKPAVQQSAPADS